MSCRTHSIVFVLSFAAVPWAMEGCGRAADVLEGTPEPDPGPDRSVGGGSGIAGTASTGGLPSFPGVAGGGGGPGFGGGVSGAGGGPNSEAQYLSVRAALAAGLCEIPLQHRCLSFTEGRVEDTHVCDNLVQLGEATRYGTRCFAEWTAHAECALQRTDYCPCGEGGFMQCLFDPWSDDFGAACSGTRQVLDACRWSVTSGAFDTAFGNVQWGLEGEKCTITGRATSGEAVGTECKAGIDGLQSCLCLINGFPLADLANGGYLNKEVAFCWNVAEQLSNGWCLDALGCCFEHNTSGVLQCNCASPSDLGFAQCQDLAASLGGRVVSSCPRYQ